MVEKKKIVKKNFCIYHVHRGFGTLAKRRAHKSFGPVEAPVFVHINKSLRLPAKKLTLFHFGNTQHLIQKKKRNEDGVHHVRRYTLIQRSSRKAHKICTK